MVLKKNRFGPRGAITPLWENDVIPASNMSLINLGDIAYLKEQAEGNINLHNPHLTTSEYNQVTTGEGAKSLFS